MKPSSLISISLYSPCHEKAENMTATSCGMYCQVCSKEVIDFSRLTDVELLDIIRKYPTGCGSFRKEQLNTMYGIPEPKQKKPFRILAGILTLISLLSIKEADAQTPQSQNATITKVDSSGIIYSTDTLGKDAKPLARKVIDVLPPMPLTMCVMGSYRTQTRFQRFFGRIWWHVRHIF